jgi:hypothetical protein
VVNTLAYYDTATTTAVKSFIVQAQLDKKTYFYKGLITNKTTFIFSVYSSLSLRYNLRTCLEKHSGQFLEKGAKAKIRMELKKFHKDLEDERGWCNSIFYYILLN